MKISKIASATIVLTTLAATTAVSVTPASAWCRWGRCGYGYRGGWGAPIAAGIVAGTALGLAAGAAVAAAPPRAYYAPGGYWACPAGYHLGPRGRACWAN